MYKQIEEYEAEVRNLGVKDAKAVVNALISGIRAVMEQ